MYEIQDPESEAIVRLSGLDVASNAIPVDVLISTLAGMQELVFIAAAANDNVRVAQRFKKSESARQKYKLLCQPAKAGSYMMPLALSNSGHVPLFQDPVWQQIEDFFGALASGSEGQIGRLFGDSSLTKRALAEVLKMLPKAGDSWNFGFSRNSSKVGEIRLGRVDAKRIDHWLTYDEDSSEAVTTITAKLQKIDFDERKISVKYPPTSQIIECFYTDDVEEDMIDYRREYIQVTGQFTLDENGNPNKLTKVSRIVPLDLSPLVLGELRYKQRRFSFRTTQVFSPSLESEYKQSLFVERLDLGIHAFGLTREELVEEMAIQMNYCWEEFVECENETMTPNAMVLKNNLSEMVAMEVIPDGRDLASCYT